MGWGVLHGYNNIYLFCDSITHQHIILADPLFKQQIEKHFHCYSSTAKCYISHLILRSKTLFTSGLPYLFIKSGGVITAFSRALLHSHVRL